MISIQGLQCWMKIGEALDTLYNRIKRLHGLANLNEISERFQDDII